ncbi:MAG: DUF3443 family protein [Acidobacteria bacterium]|nr:DUF3443 family protein [Acidobacteriota bacterium]
MRNVRSIFVFGVLGLILACGGGSNSNGGGGGGGGGIPGCTMGTSVSAGGNVIARAAANVAPLVVDGGLPNTPYLNGVFTTVMVCQPGAQKGGTNCQNIDHVLVDTGSYGLRLLQGPAGSTAGGELTLSLPQQVDSSGNLVAECAQFSDGITWGSVRMADIYIAGEAANNVVNNTDVGVPIQIIGDSDQRFATVPAACTKFGTPENTLSKLLANGIIGVGPFSQDCGLGCAPGTSSNPGIYYACASSGGCSTGSQPSVETINSQVQNPVTVFTPLPGSTAADNNGVILELPSLPGSGASVVSGSLVFGIATQGNNGLGNATMYAGDPSTANITTTFAGTPYSASFVDSGSNGYFFPSTIHTCTNNSGFYCPVSGSTPTSLTCSATTQGSNQQQTTINFNIANLDSLPAGSNAFNNVGGPNTPAPGSNGSTGFDWGLPFFYGRNVYTGVEQVDPLGNVTQPPFYAY